MKKILLILMILLILPMAAFARLEEETNTVQIKGEQHQIGVPFWPEGSGVEVLVQVDNFNLGEDQSTHNFDCEGCSLKTLYPCGDDYPIRMRCGSYNFLSDYVEFTMDVAQGEKNHLGLKRNNAGDINGYETTKFEWFINGESQGIVEETSLSCEMVELDISGEYTDNADEITLKFKNVLNTLTSISCATDFHYIHAYTYIGGDIPGGDVDIVIEGDEFDVNENSDLEFGVSVVSSCNEVNLVANNLPEGASFDGNTFSWKPDYNVVQHTNGPVTFFKTLFGFNNLEKEFDIEFVATGCDDSDSEVVTVTVQDVNRAPKIKHVRNLIIVEGELAYIYTQVKDADGDSIIYDFEAPFNDNGYWQTQIGDVGNYFFTLNIYDGYGGSDSARFNVEVVPKADSNHAPFLNAVHDAQVCLGQEVLVDLDAYDHEGDVLSYYASVPTGQTASMDASTGEFSWTPSELGQFNILFGVSDGELNNEQWATFVVEECEEPPVEKVDVKKSLSTMSAYVFGNRVKAGDTLYINTHVRNLGEVREHIRARVIIPALNVYISKYIDLDEQEDSSKVIEVQIPQDAKKGEYLALVDLTSRDSSDNEYVIFEVV
ncbi:MAG: hypothetical protein KKH88_02740 [Nanoarchaeota archaeon]|nr:hypothetical protein [Nanoarchaeota archaeon]